MSNDVIIGIAADSRRLGPGLKQAGAKVKKFTDGVVKEGKKITKKFGDAASKGFEAASDGVDKFNEGLAANSAYAAAAAAALVGYVAVVNNTASAVDEVYKSSQRLSLTLDTYQALDSAMGHAGTTMATIEAAQGGINGKLIEFQKGSKDAAKLFRNIGVEVQDASGKLKSQEDILLDSIRGLARMEDQTLRSVYAQELMGESAKQLNPLFNEGAEAVDAYLDSNESALMITEEMAKASAEYNDELQILNETFKKELNEGMQPVIEAFTDLFVMLKDTGTVESFGRSLATMMKGTAEVVDKITKGVQLFEMALTGEDVQGAIVANLHLQEAAAKARLNAAKKVRKELEEQEKIYRELNISLNGQNKQIEDFNSTIGMVVDDFEKMAEVNSELSILREQAKLTEEDILAVDKKVAELTDGKIKNMLEFIKLKREEASWETRISAEKEKQKKKTETVAGVTVDPRFEGLDEIKISALELNQALLDIEASYGQKRLDQQQKQIDQYLENQRQAKQSRIDIIKEGIDRELEIRNALVDAAADSQIRELEARHERLEEFKDFAIQSALSMSDTIVGIVQDQRRAEIDAWHKGEAEKIKSMKLSGRKEAQLLTQLDKEKEKKDREAKEREKKWAIAQVLINTGLGISKIWSQAGLAVPLAIAQSAVLSAVSAVQIAQISAQKFAQGGIVEQRNGFGVDKEPAMLTAGEMVLTKDDQLALLSQIRSGEGGTGQINLRAGDIIINGSATPEAISQIEASRSRQINEMREVLEIMNNRGELAFLS